jgi:D-lactate dehydrogenase
MNPESRPINLTNPIPFTHPQPNPPCESFGVHYTGLSALLTNSDIVSLHAPLVPATVHLINEQTISLMKDGVMLVNTSRGGLVETTAVIDAVKTRKLGYLGLDAYEEETELFFDDFSLQVISDDVFARLLTFPNVVITGHQAFLTNEALQHIAQTTVENIAEFSTTGTCRNQVRA